MLNLVHDYCFGSECSAVLHTACLYISSCRLKIWLQVDQSTKVKVDKEMRAEGGVVGGGGGKPDVQVIMGGGGGAGKPRKEVKADKQPEGPRPGLITVPDADFTVKETNPDLGKAVDYKQHYDLVEEMSYLFVRVVRARNLMGKDENGSSDPVRFCSLNLIQFS